MPHVPQPVAAGQGCPVQQLVGPLPAGVEKSPCVARAASSLGGISLRIGWLRIDQAAAAVCSLIAQEPKAAVWTAP